MHEERSRVDTSAGDARRAQLDRSFNVLHRRGKVGKTTANSGSDLDRWKLLSITYSVGASPSTLLLRQKRRVATVATSTPRSRLGAFFTSVFFRFPFIIWKTIAENELMSSRFILPPTVPPTSQPKPLLSPNPLPPAPNPMRCNNRQKVDAWGDAILGMVRNSRGLVWRLKNKKKFKISRGLIEK